MNLHEKKPTLNYIRSLLFVFIVPNNKRTEISKYATLQTLIRALGLFKWARKRIIFQVTFLDIFTTFPFPSSWMNTLESLCVCFVYLFVFGSFHSSQLVTWNCRTSVL